MKIIDVGVCLNNVDPKGIGRIRYRPYGQFKSEIERSMAYEEWDENDQFIAIPFLPAHINIIPQIRQSVKLIKYDTDKDTQNVEYVSGPFSTPHDFGSETFTTQHKNTTYGGVIVKDLPDLKDNTGAYKNSKSNDTQSKLTDTAIYGNYGSDIIFTENGVNIRGGKLLTKDTKNPLTRKKIQEIPLLSEKMAKLTLKKYSKTMEVVVENSPFNEKANSKINHIVEYTINDLTSPNIINVYVYKVLSFYGSTIDTSSFNENTEVNFSDTKKFQLINPDNTTTTPTLVVTGFTGITDASSELRWVLNTIDQKSLSELDTKYSKEDVHPFYFRPTTEFKTRTTTPTENTNRTTFISSINFKNVGINTGSGLIFSKQATIPPMKLIPRTIKNLKVVNDLEQSFGSLSADKIYLLSTTPNVGSKNKSINFTKLDQYEYTRENYLSDIEPNTFTMVRGEVLIKILRLIHELLDGHVHNINDKGIYLEAKEQELREMINSMQTDLVNQSIRIN
jgi:hypothetical protein